MRTRQTARRPVGRPLRGRRHGRRLTRHDRLHFAHDDGAVTLITGTIAVEVRWLAYKKVQVAYRLDNSAAVCVSLSRAWKMVTCGGVSVSWLRTPDKVFLRDAVGFY